MPRIISSNEILDYCIVCFPTLSEAYFDLGVVTEYDADHPVYNNRTRDECCICHKLLDESDNWFDNRMESDRQ